MEKWQGVAGHGDPPAPVVVPSRRVQRREQPPHLCFQAVEVAQREAVAHGSVIAGAKPPVAIVPEIEDQPALVDEGHPSRQDGRAQAIGKRFGRGEHAADRDQGLGETLDQVVGVAVAAHEDCVAADPTACRFQPPFRTLAIQPLDPRLREYPSPLGECHTGKLPRVGQGVQRAGRRTVETAGETPSAGPPLHGVAVEQFEAGAEPRVVLGQRFLGGQLLAGGGTLDPARLHGVAAQLVATDQREDLVRDADDRLDQALATRRAKALDQGRGPLVQTEVDLAAASA